MDRFVSKENYEAALRGHQAAVDATKSEQRDETEENQSQGKNQDESEIPWGRDNNNNQLLLAHLKFLTFSIF